MCEGSKRARGTIITMTKAFFKNTNLMKKVEGWHRWNIISLIIKSPASVYPKEIQLTQMGFLKEPNDLISAVLRKGNVVVPKTESTKKKWPMNTKIS